jgi:hypothetical protein
MMCSVGQTDAGSVAVGQAHRTVSLSNGGERPTRDSRPGATDSRLPVRCTQTGLGERPSPFNPPSPPVGDGHPELPHAFENSDLPKAGRSP